MTLFIVPIQRQRLILSQLSWENFTIESTDQTVTSNDFRRMANSVDSLNFIASICPDKDLSEIKDN